MTSSSDWAVSFLPCLKSTVSRSNAPASLSPSDTSESCCRRDGAARELPLEPLEPREPPRPLELDAPSREGRLRFFSEAKNASGMLAK